ncbi:inositol monophosphatase family protein [Modicisalibacter luteus]|uniref:Inositol-1-monophosphatase n=1 Tax=Modicisalibacter luteus TaxID=453962 RepID=A0ABV7M349_9GAMM|nr:inositol monophosphatase family protein [Halomonas lutea]GHA85907.1 inositol monophosphatase [Halomonas lutea]
MRDAERLAIATDIAEQAGRMIQDARLQSRFDRRYKKNAELVTDADVAVDQFIADQLERHFPGEPRLTEELSPDKESMERKGPLWVVDPIDGTVNFAQGLPHVAVSIAWAQDGKVHVGVVHAPFLEETFTALRGEGARLNDRQIRASTASSLERSLVATGFPYRRESRAPLVRRLTSVLEHCQDIRRCGSAALDLCNVACGRLEAYYESVSPWDSAAGLLIAREAGARTGHLYPVPDTVPEELYSEHILAAAPDIYKPMKELLIRADEERYHHE